MLGLMIERHKSLKIVPKPNDNRYRNGLSIVELNSGARLKTSFNNGPSGPCNLILYLVVSSHIRKIQ